MRHRKRTVKLGRTSSHKKAMLRNMVCSLIDHGQIKTSKAKAKAARSLADKVVHLAISGNDTAKRRRVFQLLGNKESVKHLFDEVAGKFSKNNGGYTKIVPFGNAKGDNTEMVFFLLSYDVAEKSKSGSTMKYHFKKKKTGKTKQSQKTEQENAPVAEEAEDTSESTETSGQKEKEEEPSDDQGNAGEEAEEKGQAGSDSQEQDGSSEKEDKKPSEQSDENK